MSHTSVEAKVLLLVLVCFGTRLGYETAVGYFGTRDSSRDGTTRLLMIVLGRATLKKTGQTRLKENFAMRLSLFSLRRATQKKTGLCNCCTWLCDRGFYWDARLRR